jgi:aryl-alcohol dehydrogenase-like predicted oxidoreductase
MHPTLGPDGPAVSRLGLGCMSMLTKDASGEAGLPPELSWAGSG